MTSPPEIPFEKIIEALLDADTPFPPRYLYRLSDLGKAELAQLQAAWSKIPLWRRQALIEDTEELGESDTVLWFFELGRLAAGDEDPKVRQLALRSLWEYEEPRIVPDLLEMLNTDPDPEARAEVAHLLGKYIYLGELEELPEKTLHQIEQRLLKVMESNEPGLVRRAALEALGFSSSDEAATWIEQSFASSDREWVASALFAMGRSADARWAPQVLAMLASPAPALRSEAARAAGEIEIAEAVPVLLELLDDLDDDTRAAAIWSLSQIGGEGVSDALQALLDDTEDEADIEFIETALENLSFAEGLAYMPALRTPADGFELLEEEDDEDEGDFSFSELEGYLEDEDDDHED
jgi:HEAT repeat protein